MNPLRVLVQSLSTHVRQLDEKSRHRMRVDEELRTAVAAERSDRRADQELRIALFTSSLPAWVARPDRFEDPAVAADAIDPLEVVPPEGVTAGLDWAVAADVELDRAASRWQRFWARRRAEPERWIVARPVRAPKRMSGRRHDVLSRNTRLRLVGRSAVKWRRREDESTLTVMDAPLEDRGLVFEVTEGPHAGRLVHLSAVSRWASAPALVAAAMIAPAGHRIVDWPSASASVLARLESRAADAERSSREIAYEDRWAWRHDLVGRPIARSVTLRRERADDESDRPVRR